MAQNDIQPIDDDLNPGSYSFGDAAPVKREAPPLRIGKYDHSEPEEDERKSRRNKKQRDAEEDSDRRDKYDDPFKSRRDIKDPFEEFVKPRPWWFWSVVLMILGATSLMIAAVVAGLKLDPRAGMLVFGLCLVGVLVQTVAVAFLLMFVGQAFGIDYGPVKEAFVKLAACVAFVNGFTLLSGAVLVSGFGPLGVLMAISMISLIMFAVFSAQFKLAMMETLITIFVIEFCAWSMGVGLGFVLMRQLMLKG